MKRYRFAAGKVTVEEGLYTPAQRDTVKPSLRAVTIVFTRKIRPSYPESQSNQEESHVQQDQSTR